MPTNLPDKDVIVRVTKTHINLANLLVRRMALGSKQEHKDAIRLLRGAFAFRFAAMQAASSGKPPVQEMKNFMRNVLKTRQMFINFIKLYSIRVVQ